MEEKMEDKKEEKMEEKNKCNCHDHDSEGCGCGEDCECHGDDVPVIFVTFEDEEGEVPCDVMGIFEVEDISYIAIVPQDSDEVLLYRYSENGDEVNLTDIETDEEFQKVSDEFYANFFEEEE